MHKTNYEKLLQNKFVWTEGDFFRISVLMREKKKNKKKVNALGIIVM